MQPSEIRSWPLELRAQNGRRMVGRLISYNREYDLGRFTEAYRPGCFKKSITERARSLPLMIEHGHEKIPVGVSVEWLDDDQALHGVWEFDTRAEAVEAARLAENRMLSGLSVGFQPVRTNWSQRADGRQHADRAEASMVETSLCSLPALQDAGVIAVRSLGPGVVDVARTPHLDEARQWLASLRSGTLTNNG